MAASDAPPWNAVLLVCRACRKRSNGPREPKAKAIAQALKRSVREARPRPRVLLTSCLGLCPKRATAVARLGADGNEARIVALVSIDDLEKLQGA
ncbi:MAG: hypothetical protein ABI781_01590 [Burkholderiales bacterium]